MVVVTKMIYKVVHVNVVNLNIKRAGLLEKY